MTGLLIAPFVIPPSRLRRAGVDVTATTQQTGAPDGRRVKAMEYVSTEKIVEEPEVEISTNGKVVGPAPRRGACVHGVFCSLEADFGGSSVTRS